MHTRRAKQAGSPSWIRRQIARPRKLRTAREQYRGVLSTRDCLFVSTVGPPTVALSRKSRSASAGRNTRASYAQRPLKVDEARLAQFVLFPSPPQRAASTAAAASVGGGEECAELCHVGKLLQLRTMHALR